MVTSLPQSDRFFAPGITKALFLPVVANSTKSSADPNYCVPTGPEVAAGIDLSDEIADWSGFSLSSNFIDTPDLGSLFTGTVPGRISSEASSITFYADRDGQDVREILPRTTQGFILIADGGLATGKKADVFPIEVGSVGKPRSVSDTASQLTINVSIRRQPAQDVTLPTIA